MGAGIIHSMMIFLLFLLILPLGGLLAQERDPIKYELLFPEAEDEGDGRFRFALEDGRTAVLHQAYRPLHTSFRIIISRNSCLKEEAPLPQCRIETDSILSYFFYRWENNPINPEREGEAIIQTNIVFGVLGNERIFGWNDVISSFDQFIQQSLGFNNLGTRNLEALLSCDQFDWLPGQGESEQELIPTWTNASFQPNRGALIQRQDVLSYNGMARWVHLKRRDPFTYAIEDVGLIHHRFHPIYFLILTDQIDSLHEFTFPYASFRDHPAKKTQTGDDSHCSIEFSFHQGDKITIDDLLKGITGEMDDIRSHSRPVNFEETNPYLRAKNREQTENLLFEFSNNRSELQ